MAVSDNTEPIKGVNVFSAWTLLPDDTQWAKALEYADKPAFDCVCTTLDLEAYKYGPPDFIKIDVDGYEYRVLRGGVETLGRSKPPILFEYSFLLEKIGDGLNNMSSLIYGLGYQAWSMDGKYCAKTERDFINCYPAHTSFDCMLIHPENPVA